MRRGLALLLALFVTAASAEAGALWCVGPAGFVADSHACCADAQAVSLATGNTCCVISRQEHQARVIEPRALAPQLHTAAVPISLHLFVESSRKFHVPPRGSQAATVPIYLRHASLLI